MRDEDENKKDFSIRDIRLHVLRFPGCKDSDDVGENYTTFTGETVSDFLQDNEEYSAFVDALKTANALPLLESYGAYTCFVPNNAAMGGVCERTGLRVV